MLDSVAIAFLARGALAAPAFVLYSYPLCPAYECASNGARMHIRSFRCTFDNERARIIRYLSLLRRYDFYPETPNTTCRKKPKEEHADLPCGDSRSKANFQASTIVRRSSEFRTPSSNDITRRA